MQDFIKKYQIIMSTIVRRNKEYISEYLKTSEKISYKAKEYNIEILYKRKIFKTVKNPY